MSLLDYWRQGGCHRDPFLVETLDRHRSLSVIVMAGDRLELTSLCPVSLPNITRLIFGQDKTLRTSHIMRPNPSNDCLTELQGLGAGSDNSFPPGQAWGGLLAVPWLQ